MLSQVSRGLSPIAWERASPGHILVKWLSRSLHRNLMRSAR